MRSLMLILVCALSVSARCVKKHATNDQTPVVQKGAATKQTAQTGPGRNLLEESSAGSEGSSSSTSSGSGDTSSSGGSSTNTNKDTSNTSGASPTTTDGSYTDPSNTEDEIPSSTPSVATGDTSSTEGTSSSTTSGNSNSDSGNTSGNESGNTSGNGSGKNSPSTGNNSTTSGEGYTNQTSSTETSASTSSGGSSGGCGSMKNVCFNSGMQPSMFDQMKSASNWITFGLDIPGGTPSERAKQAHIPMMAFAEHVTKTIDMVNGPDAPEWMLTFNEPDHSYMEITPKMTGKEAAAAIAPLLAQRGSKTKFIAPGPARWDGPFLEEFFAECNCKDFFSAYNMHSYTAEAENVIKDIEAYHSKWNDKPLWITELAPGGCGKSPETVGKFFKDIFKFSKDSGFVDKVMWNTGNQIDAKDSNVCDTWLVDGSGKPGPLLEIFESMDCS